MTYCIVLHVEKVLCKGRWTDPSIMWIIWVVCHLQLVFQQRQQVRGFDHMFQGENNCETSLGEVSRLHRRCILQ